MTRNTGLLTTQCDPYGVESTIKLFGGIYPEKMMGKHVWYCGRPADAGTFRLICRGGDYGTRLAPDGGTVPAYHCDGGHRGLPMPLCRDHQREFATYGSARPKPLRTPEYDSDGNVQHWAPGSVIGGSKANETCPRCAMPPEAQELDQKASYLTGEIGRYMMAGLDLASPVLRMRQELDGVRAQLDELNLTGRIHKCPLILREVS